MTITIKRWLKTEPVIVGAHIKIKYGLIVNGTMTQPVEECSANLLLAAAIIHDFVCQVLLASVVLNDCG